MKMLHVCPDTGKEYYEGLGYAEPRFHLTPKDDFINCSIKAQETLLEDCAKKLKDLLYNQVEIQLHLAEPTRYHGPAMGFCYIKELNSWGMRVYSKATRELFRVAWHEYPNVTLSGVLYKCTHTESAKRLIARIPSKFPERLFYVGAVDRDAVLEEIESEITEYYTK